MKHYFVYILSNWNRKVLYIGVTNNILRRLGEHQSGLIEGFTKKYQVHDLLYWEEYDDPTEAIKWEKELKRWTRRQKNQLIATKNPEL